MQAYPFAVIWWSLFFQLNDVKQPIPGPWSCLTAGWHRAVLMYSLCILWTWDLNQCLNWWWVHNSSVCPCWTLFWQVCCVCVQGGHVWWTLQICSARYRADCHFSAQPPSTKSPSQRWKEDCPHQSASTPPYWAAYCAGQYKRTHRRNVTARLGQLLKWI